MRIKEEIKRSGEFWLPSFPKNKVDGTLLISDGGDITLELTRSFDPSIKAQLIPTHPDSLNPILGHVEKDGYVMIDRCDRTKKGSSIIHGRLIAPEVICANRVFMGIPPEEDVSPRFNSFSFSVEGIDEWVGISGIEVDHHSEKRAVTISYDKPSDISLDLQNGMQLLITFTSTFPGFPNLKSAAVSQKTYFRLISQKARELDEFTAIAQKITAFLCFVMDEIVCVDSMSASSNNLRQDIGNGRTAPVPVKIYCPSWPYAKNEPTIDEWDMLFKYEDRQNHVESIINKWIDNYENITPALDLYFLTKAGTLPTMDLQFLTLVQALEAFHRRTSDEMHMDADECKDISKKMIGACPEEHKDWFSPKLLRANELTLHNRFERMTEPFSNFMCGERRLRLIKRIKDTRNYLTHYDSDLESKAAKGEVLTFLCRKMNTLFRLQFLKLIGFDKQEIDDIVDKSYYFKRECNLY